MTLSSLPFGSSRVHLFVYGTLVDPLKLDEIIGHCHQGERLRARLLGYRRVVSDQYPYPYLMPSSAEAVEGILVMDLTAADLRALDVYEEVAQGTYARSGVEVDVWGCGPRSARLPAQVYVSGEGLKNLTGRWSALAQPTPSTTR